MTRLPKRDPAMYGEHHLCHKCGEKARYISRNTHWCKMCLDNEEYPHLVGMTQEERDALQAKNLAKIGATLINANNMQGKIGF